MRGSWLLWFLSGLGSTLSGRWAGGSQREVEVRGGIPKIGHGTSDQLRKVLPGWLEGRCGDQLLGPVFKGQTELF